MCVLWESDPDFMHEKFMLYQLPTLEFLFDQVHDFD